MKKAAILLGLVLGLAQTGSALAGDVAAGEARAAACGACHGADGNSPVPSFPKLAGQNEKYLIKQMTDIRDGARPIPTMVGQLDNASDEEIANIAAFYTAQGQSGGQAKAGLVELGEQVYRGGVSGRNVPACSACHSPRGNGNAPAGYPSLAGQHAEYIAAQLKMYRMGYEDPAGRTNDGDAKIMRTIAFGLSDKEIEAVSSYIAGLN